MKRNKTRNASLVATLCLLLLAVLVASCGVTRQASGTSDGARAARAIRHDSPLASLAQPLATHTDLSLRMAVEATYGQKTMPVKGNLRMRRGEVIQMAFTALGMIEVARVEITPDAVWVIDRLNKQYARVRYSELPLVGGSLVNYALLESLLWNELFLLGQKDVKANLDKFVVKASGTQQLIEPREQQTLACRFWTDQNLTRLQRTRLQWGSFLSDWTYAGYQLVDDTRYPSSMTATLEGEGKQISAQFAFTNITLDNREWVTRTNLTNYTRITATELLSRLSFMK